MIDSLNFLPWEITENNSYEVCKTWTRRETERAYFLISWIRNSSHWHGRLPLAVRRPNFPLIPTFLLLQGEGMRMDRLQSQCGWFLDIQLAMASIHCNSTLYQGHQVQCSWWPLALLCKCLPQEFVHAAYRRQIIQLNFFENYWTRWSSKSLNSRKLGILEQLDPKYVPHNWQHNLPCTCTQNQLHIHALGIEHLKFKSIYTLRACEVY